MFSGQMTGKVAADARANDNFALRWASDNGHLAVVKYLYVGFGLTIADARANDNYALVLACRYGHLEVVKYLHDIFGLAAADARAAIEEAKVIITLADAEAHKTTVELQAAMPKLLIDERVRKNGQNAQAISNMKVPTNMWYGTGGNGGTEGQGEMGMLLQLQVLKTLDAQNQPK